MLIVLIGHIIIAVSGLVVATVSLVNLSQKMINLSYVFTVGTLASGTALVIAAPESLLKSCLSGLLYLAAILCLTALAKYRLAAQKIQ